MWRLINLIFLVLCFFTDKYAGHGPNMDAGHERPSNPDVDESNERPWIPDMEANNQRQPIPDVNANNERPQTPNIDENKASPPNKNSLGGGNSPKNDDENPEGHRNGIILIVFVSVAGVVVLLVVVTCGLYIVKKRHMEIETRNYQVQANGTMEKQQLPFPTIFPENHPPYTSKMEEGEMKSAPMEFLGYGTGWYTPAIVSMPPPYTKIVDKSFHPDSTAAP